MRKRRRLALAMAMLGVLRLTTAWGGALGHPTLPGPITTVPQEGADDHV